MTIVYSIFVGLVGALAWSKALNINLSISLLVGGIAGIIIGIIVSLLGKAARVGGNVQQGEAKFVNNSIIIMFAVFVIGTGILAWIIRLIFF